MKSHLPNYLLLLFTFLWTTVSLPDDAAILTPSPDRDLSWLVTKETLTQSPLVYKLTITLTRISWPQWSIICLHLHLSVKKWSEIKNGEIVILASDLLELFLILVKYWSEIKNSDIVILACNLLNFVLILVKYWSEIKNSEIVILASHLLKFVLILYYTN